MPVPGGLTSQKSCVPKSLRPWGNPRLVIGRFGEELKLYKSKLQAAPTLERNQWSQLDNPQFTSQGGYAK